MIAKFRDVSRPYLTGLSCNGFSGLCCFCGVVLQKHPNDLGKAIELSVASIQVSARLGARLFVMVSGLPRFPFFPPIVQSVNLA